MHPAHRLTAALATIAIAALQTACSDIGTPVQPHPSPSAPSLSSAPAARERVVDMKDACDPRTFNAVLGEGTCTRWGGVTFERFIAQLTAKGVAEAWRFTPALVELEPGQVLRSINRGGEFHTFTEVEKFGGGIVPLLNQLSHNTDVAPECAALAPSAFIAPGGTQRDEVHGTELYQCCIHPWMRMTATVRQHT